MHTVLLVIQIIISISLVGVILIQRSSTDGLSGLGGGGGGGGSFLSGRASANLLTRVTTILAALFMLNSLLLATLSSQERAGQKSLMDSAVSSEAPAGKANMEQKPVAPSVPAAQ